MKAEIVKKYMAENDISNKDMAKSVGMKHPTFLAYLSKGEFPESWDPGFKEIMRAGALDTTTNVLPLVQEICLSNLSRNTKISLLSGLI